RFQNITNRIKTFETWYLQKGEKWKIAAYDELTKSNEYANKYAQERYFISEPHDYIYCNYNNYYEGDKILTFLLGENSISNLKWLNIDGICISGEKEFPYLALQSFSSRTYSQPPFQEKGKFFIKCLYKSLMNEYKSRDKILSEAIVPSNSFLKDLYHNFIESKVL